MFLLKTFFSRFLFPLPLSLELLLVGLILLWCTRRQRAGKALVTLGTALLLAFSNVSISNALVRHLERRYPPFAVGHLESIKSNVTYIAVLGGSTNDDPNVPITSHISPDVMVRLVEGVLLQHAIPGSKLILSAGNESAGGMTKLSQALGVRMEDILHLDGPRNTEEESQQIAHIVGKQPFVLVTSASHMPRAMAFCRKRGLQPMAAPSDYLAPRQQWELGYLFPDGFFLFKSQVAVYEYLGLLWETFRGGI